MPFPDTLNVNPAGQAGRILQAFASGNEPLLQQELQRSQTLGIAANRGLEEERFELLHALSLGMLRACGSLSEGRRDPAVRRCLDLLGHLAQAPSVKPGLTLRFTSSLHN